MTSSGLVALEHVYIIYTDIHIYIYIIIYIYIQCSIVFHIAAPNAKHPITDDQSIRYATVFCPGNTVSRHHAISISVKRHWKTTCVFPSSMWSFLKKGFPQVIRTLVILRSRNQWYWVTQILEVPIRGVLQPQRTQNRTFSKTLAESTFSTFLLGSLSNASPFSP